jgi:predicted RNA-binding protein with PUA-like domain
MIGTEGGEPMWLVKTEPSEYGYDDLEREGRAVWDGVSNPAALKNLRAMKEGDDVFVYHTGDVKAAVGVAEVVRAAYPSPGSRNPKQVVVDLKAVRRLKAPVTLAEIKSLSSFAESPLVRQGRLSVVPLNAAQWKAIESRGEK